MKAFLALILSLLAVGCAVTNRRNLDPDFKTKPHHFAVDKDTIQFIGSVDKVSSTQELQRLINVPDDQEVNVFIQANYADIDFLKDVIAVLKAKNAVCYSRQASGPGFSLLQACKVRLVGQTTELYARRLVASFQNVNVDAAREMTEKLLGYEKEITGVEADSVGLSLSDYVTKLGDQGLKMTGAQAILQENAADGVGILECKTEDTMERNFVLKMLPMGQGMAILKITMSVCPEPRQVLDPPAPAQAFEYFGLVVDQAALPQEPSRDL